MYYKTHPPHTPIYPPTPSTPLTHTPTYPHTHTPHTKLCRSLSMVLIVYEMKGSKGVIDKIRARSVGTSNPYPCYICTTAININRRNQWQLQNQCFRKQGGRKSLRRGTGKKKSYFYAKIVKFGLYYLKLFWRQIGEKNIWCAQMSHVPLPPLTQHKKYSKWFAETQRT